MPAVAANAKPADAATHEPNPDCVGELMSEDIKQDRARKTEERDQPKNGAQRKKPEFFPCPEPLRNCRARERSEKCLRKNCADRQQENRENKFYPTGRHNERLGRRDEASRSRARNASDNLSAALGFTLSAIVLR